jgi:beta-galactosidase/beta-glucuronidase
LKLVPPQLESGQGTVLQLGRIETEGENMEYVALALAVAGMAFIQRTRPPPCTDPAVEEDQEFSNVAGNTGDVTAPVVHEDPRRQSQGRSKRCATLCYFDSAATARNHVGQPAKSSRVTTLNGLWRFELFNSFEQGWKQIHTCSTKHKLYDVVVPGSWQLQVVGDAPIYTNFKYIIPVDPPNVPIANPTGYYKREFTIDTNLLPGNDMYVSFGAVDSFFHLWINRQYVGFSKDSRLSADFNITKYLAHTALPDSVGSELEGPSEVTVLLEVLVLRYSDGHYLEDQDMFNLSGIFRDVLLYAVSAQVSLCDFTWRQEGDADTRSTTVTVDAYVKQRLADATEGVDESRGRVRSWDYAIQAQLFDEGVLVSSSYPVAASLRGLVQQNSTKTAEFNPPQPTFVFEKSNIATPLCSATAPFQSHDTRADAEETEQDLHLSDLQEEGYFVRKLSLKLALPEHQCHSWSAERPYVYTLVVNLLSLQGIL